MDEGGPVTDRYFLSSYPIYEPSIFLPLFFHRRFRHFKGTVSRDEYFSEGALLVLDIFMT
jgi:hypothetical protein